MAINYEAPQPISTPKSTFKNYQRESTIISMPLPVYIPKKKKNPSKCLVYFLIILVLLVLFLLVFASVLKIKHPSLTIDSIKIKSLKYDNSSNSPSFNIITHMSISLENRNFGHFEFDHMNKNMSSTMNLVYGNGTVVGTSQLKFASSRVVSRGEERVEVDVVMMSSSKSVLRMDDNEKLISDLNSGVLEFMCYATVEGEVHLLKKFRFHTVALMNCDVAVDLERQLVLKLVCL